MSSNMKKDENKRVEGKRGLVEFLAVKASLPSDILSGELRIEIRGRNTLYLQGCRRIMTYSPTEMVLLAKSCIIKVAGERLVCSSYHDGTVTVEGLIDGVQFVEKEEGMQA